MECVLMILPAHSPIVYTPIPQTIEPSPLDTSIIVSIFLINTNRTDSTIIRSSYMCDGIFSNKNENKHLQTETNSTTSSPIRVHRHRQCSGEYVTEQS